jgi:hypothetical protein
MAAWSDAEIDQVPKCFAQGMTNAAIAAQLGRTRSAVAGRLLRSGLSVRQFGGGAARSLIAGARRKSAVAIADRSAFEFDGATYTCKPAPGFPGKPLLELTANQCRYPIDPTADDPRVLFCAAPTSAGTSWCAYHFAICYCPEPEPTAAHSTGNRPPVRFPSQAATLPTQNANAHQRLPKRYPSAFCG